MSKSDKLKAIKEGLVPYIEDRKEALPVDLNKPRFVQNCMAVLDGVKDLEKYTSASIITTMTKGAFLGLDFFQGEAYPIPYGSTLTFQTSYKGEVKLVKKYSIRPIKDVYAKVVKDGDEYLMEERNGQQDLTFKPLAFNDGKIKGAFAIVTYADGGIQIEEMSLLDIENVRSKYSKQPKGLAWLNSYGEMCRKTVLRRLCKHINIDFANPEQQQAFADGGDADFNKKKEPVVATSSLDDISESNNEDVIDAEFEDKDVPPDVSESNKETA